MTTPRTHLIMKREVDNTRSVLSDAGAGPAFVDGRQCPNTVKDSK